MKPAWRSRTIWFFSLLLALSGIPEVQQVVPADWLVRISAIAGIALRLLTSEPVRVR